MKNPKSFVLGALVVANVTLPIALFAASANQGVVAQLSAVILAVVGTFTAAHLLDGLVPPQSKR